MLASEDSDRRGGASALKANFGIVSVATPHPTVVGLWTTCYHIVYVVIHVAESIIMSQSEAIHTDSADSQKSQELEKKAKSRRPASEIADHHAGVEKGWRIRVEADTCISI